MRGIWVGVVLAAWTTAAAADSHAPAKRCAHVLAADHAAADLRLVGIVEIVQERRTQSMLIIDQEERFYVVHADDCVGRERVSMDLFRVLRLRSPTLIAH